MKAKIVGVVWYKEEDYLDLKSLFVDGDNLPSTYQEWLRIAQQRLDEISASGHRVERVFVDPETFPAWCRSQSFNINGNARTEFANKYVFLKYSHGN